jgi:hypothetical protein
MITSEEVIGAPLAHTGTLDLFGEENGYACFWARKVKTNGVVNLFEILTNEFGFEPATLVVTQPLQKDFTLMIFLRIRIRSLGVFADYHELFAVVKDILNIALEKNGQPNK